MYRWLEVQELRCPWVQSRPKRAHFPERLAEPRSPGRAHVLCERPWGLYSARASPFAEIRGGTATLGCAACSSRRPRIVRET